MIYVSGLRTFTGSNPRLLRSQTAHYLLPRMSELSADDDEDRAEEDRERRARMAEDFEESSESDEGSDNDEDTGLVEDAVEEENEEDNDLAKKFGFEAYAVRLIFSPSRSPFFLVISCACTCAFFRDSPLQTGTGTEA
jgi:hypothetical protein